MEGEISTGKQYYRKHRDKNIEAVKAYRQAHSKDVSHWNRKYYRTHRNPKTGTLYGKHIEPFAYHPREKYTRWSPYHYVDDETFMNNLRDLTLYYKLHCTDTLCVHTYRTFYREW